MYHPPQINNTEKSINNLQLPKDKNLKAKIKQLMNCTVEIADQLIIRYL